ncbi:MAG TPA: MFS transporter [Opitutaceae bacterium]|jgi:ACS family D-galactonate transporter-like MFS transporter
MGTRTTRARHGVALLLFVTVAINYLDRSNLSVAALGLSRDLSLDPVHLGIIFSGFAWTYAFFQVPGGWLVDRFGPRGLYASICALWSLATLAQGLCSTFLALLACRLLLGLFEAPSFPTCNLLVTRWFPEAERGRVIGLYTSAQYIGLAFLTPVLVLAQRRLGWHAVFFMTGAIGIAWAGIWLLAYRDPWAHAGLGEHEREHLLQGGAWSEGAHASGSYRRPTAADLRVVLTHRSLWGIYLGQFALNAVPWFFLTWFPTYLERYRHIDLARTGYSSSLPFLAAFLGVNASGLLSDLLPRLGVSGSAARKAPIIAGLLCSTSIIAANYVSSTPWIVFFMALSFFGNGFASITWVLVSLIAPRELMGLTGGIFNFFGNLAGILVPLLIGFVVKEGGFAPALLLVFGITTLGVLSYALLVGPVRRIELPQAAGAPPLPARGPGPAA